MWRANEMQHQIELEEAREEGRELGIEQGRESIIEILARLKNGESIDNLLANGISEELIDQIVELI